MLDDTALIEVCTLNFILNMWEIIRLPLFYALHDSSKEFKVGGAV